MVIKWLFCSLKDLHQKCTKEMDDYVGCMYYHTNEFDLCRKEQQEFEKKCSLEWNQSMHALPLSKIITTQANLECEQMRLFLKYSFDLVCFVWIFTIDYYMLVI